MIYFSEKAKIEDFWKKLVYLNLNINVYNQIVSLFAKALKEKHSLLYRKDSLTNYIGDQDETFYVSLSLEKDEITISIFDADGKVKSATIQKGLHGPYQIINRNNKAGYIADGYVITTVTEVKQYNETEHLVYDESIKYDTYLDDEEIKKINLTTSQTWYHDDHSASNSVKIYTLQNDTETTSIDYSICPGATDGDMGSIYTYRSVSEEEFEQFKNSKSKVLTIK